MNTFTRTLGLEYETITLYNDGVGRGRAAQDARLRLFDDSMRVKVQDYGGQRGFHLIQDLFFHGGYAIYAILLRLDKLTAFAAVDRLNYWLQFLNSTARTGDILIVLSGHVGKREEAVRRALNEFLAYNFHDNMANVDQATGAVTEGSLLHEGLRIHRQLYSLDCRKSGSAEMKELRRAFYNTFHEMEEVIVVAMYTLNDLKLTFSFVCLYFGHLLRNSICACPLLALH